MPLFEKQKIFVYNSLTGRKEAFTPIHFGNVGMYACGPTVYNFVHLGNVRTFISFDVIYRYLKFLGYKVRYVRNITDAGHLENDADEGEDRISKKARIESLEPMEVVQRYTLYYHHILRQFNLLPPSIEPTATGHIVEQIELIKKIIEKGLAYLVNGSVYFDVHKYNETDNYGLLSKRKLEDLIHNTRQLEGQSDKRHPQDFALWKKAEPEHIMRWPSPWSIGFPGWHLECTAMSTKYLGKQFDIHGGGMDLKFPHHECEIAQAVSINKIQPVKYWLHANMLIMNGRKMSKSTGNFILPDEIFSGKNPNISRAYSPSVARFFMLQAHYRSVLDFTDQGLKAAEKGYLRLMNGLKEIHHLKASGCESTVSIQAWIQTCYEALNDDFNTPVLIAHLFEAVKMAQRIKKGEEKIDIDDLTLLKQSVDGFVFDVLGLKKREVKTVDYKGFEGTIDILIRLREKARAEKNFMLSDQIRDELAAVGIQLKDGKNETSYTVNTSFGALKNSI